tara:strand:+ start:924 stop:2123 length:1200 start_codon:yes stop_codon:yes gene_type:complete
LRYKYFFILILSLLFPNSDKYTLVVSFDGFRHDYINRVPTPNFDKFINGGVMASSLSPVFPSLTFPNHYSLATGYHANEHKILGNKFFSKTLNKDYSMRDSKAVQNGQFYGMEPIWVTAEKNNILSATYFWIGSEAEINGYRPTIYKKYDGSVKFKSRVDSVISWYNLPVEQRPKLTMLYFSEPDYTGHEYGPNSNEVNKSIIEMDSIFGYLIDELSRTKVYHDLDIIVVSDHGMSDVSLDKVILLDKFIDLDKYKVIPSFAVTHLWNLNENEDISRIFDNENNVQIFKKGRFPKKYHFSNSDSPDYLIVADLGWSLTTTQKLSQSKSFPGGMHGYDSKFLEMHGIFFANGPSFKSDVRIDSFENINLYPIICKTLGISPYKKNVHWDDNLLNNSIIFK